MEQQSLWLGPLRVPVRMAAVTALFLTLATASWLILGRIFGWSDVGMHEMLRPGGRILVYLLLWSLLATVILAGIYLSDSRASIEVEPTGPLDILALVISRVSMIAVVAIVMVMFYEVIARYVFEKPTLWANELSLWIAGFVFMLAGLYAMQQRSHIRIYIVYDIMPRWAQKTADVISVFLIWVFCFALVWGGFNEARDKFGRMEVFGTAWDPPIPATIKPAILIIICLVALQALSNLIADWNKAPEHHTPIDDIDESEIEHLKKTLGEK